MNLRNKRKNRVDLYSERKWKEKVERMWRNWIEKEDR